jgi:hypothetical protein
LLGRGVLGSVVGGLIEAGCNCKACRLCLQVRGRGGGSVISTQDAMIPSPWFLFYCYRVKIEEVIEEVGRYNTKR